MAVISDWIMKILIVAAVASLCEAAMDTWPNFSCHPFNATSYHVNARSYRHMSWNSCLEPYEKWNGKCVKACVLLRSKTLVRISKDKPLIFSTDAFIHALQKELGYGEKESPPAPAMEILNKVRSGVDECRTKYPEFAQLDPKGHSCDPWSNLTTCITTAVGC